MKSFARRLAPLLVLITAAAVAGPTLAAADAPDTTASISGTIVGPHGPENDVWVILEENGTYKESTWTLADGRYRFDGLPADTYNLHMIPTDALRIDQIPIVLSAGEQRTYDQVVSVGDAIVGTVRNTAGGPIAGAQVLAQKVGEPSNHGTLSAADGTYTISGLTAGSYRISVLPPVQPIGYGGLDRGLVDVVDAQPTVADITLAGTAATPPATIPTPAANPQPYAAPYADPTPPSDPAPDSGPAPAPPKPRVSLQRTSLRVAVPDGAVVDLACAARAACRGTATLRLGSLALGHVRFAIAAGRDRRVRVPLGSHARRILRRHHGSLRAQLVVTGTGAIARRFNVKLIQH